jgi:heterodisulfide reductase subunit C
MAKTAGEIVSEYSLFECLRCGMCDDACPSGRNGGVHPDAVISKLLDADPGSEISAFCREVWKCLVCHRCSITCPKEIDVADLMISLRYSSALSGNTPKRFRRTGETLVKEGRAFPVDEMVNRRRTDLGLTEIKDDAASIEEMRKILSVTGFHEK